MRHFHYHGPPSKVAAICKGAAVGLLVGLASIATVDKKSLAILRVVGKPVEWVTWVAQKLFGLSDGSTALMGWFGMGIWCMILGGLIGWVVSILYSKATGDE
jgi:hypothetical protein